MALEIPEFETQMRGFDRHEVSDYIARLHHEIDVLQDRSKSLEASKSQTLIDREQLVAQFKALSAETAEHQARRLDESAQARQQATDQLLTPVRESLQRFNDRLTEVEKARVAMSTEL